METALSVVIKQVHGIFPGSKDRKIPRIAPLPLRWICVAGVFDASLSIVGHKVPYRLWVLAAIRNDPKIVV
jgi:hypothetical protein